MFALILAGGRFDANDPLFIETGVANKALIPIAGKPMVQWVAEALSGSERVEGLIIAGLEPGQVDSIQAKPIYYTPDRGSIVDNALAAAEVIQKYDPHYECALLATSDIPLLTPAMVDRFIDLCLAAPGDAYYTLVSERTMTGRFPDSKRTFVRMKGGRYCGGDLFLFRSNAPEKINLELLRGVTGERKNFLAQARMVGFGFILRFLLGLMDIHEAAHRAGKPFNLNGAVIDFPHPEAAMDVDKLPHYQLVKTALETRPDQP